MNFYKHPKLLEALDLYTREQDERLPDEKELKSITFSEEFLERMRRMIARHRWGYYALFGTVGRRVASILVALLIAATTATVSVEALREKVFQFFAEVFEKYTQISFADDTSTLMVRSIDPQKPTYIPEKYTLTTENQTDTHYYAIYINDVGEQILIEQWDKNINIGIDTEGTQFETLTIKQTCGVTYYNKETANILFEDASYSYRISGTCSLDILIKIAESIL